MVEYWRLPAAWLCAAVIAAFVLIDVVMLSQSSITLACAGFLGTAVIVGVCLAAIRFSWNDAFNPVPEDSALKTRMAQGVHQFAALALLLGVFGAVGAPASYLLITPGIAFHDATYAAIDQAMGLDWLAMLAWANSHPALSWGLIVAYHTCLPQIVVVMAILVFSGRFHAAWNFMAALLFGGLVTIVISGLYPAVAPYAFYDPDPSLYANLEAITPNVGQSFLQDLRALQDGTFTVFNLATAHGIITFPSYHTVMGILFVYAVRDVRWAFGPMLVLNIVMIIATVPIGGHYFIDIAGGALVAFAGIVLVNVLNARAPNWVGAVARLWARPAAQPHVATNPL